MSARSLALALAGTTALYPAIAAAQSSPGFVTGQVPTAAQWNSYFAAKQDVLGYVPLNSAGGSMTGRLVTSASTTSRAGLSIPAGTAPSAPIDGDVWTTTSGAFFRINGSTLQVQGAGQAAGGDLGGTYPNPSVLKVNGVSFMGTPSLNSVPVAASSSIANWTPLASISLGAITDQRVAYTGAHTLLNSEKGKTIALGGNALFTLTLDTTNTYDADYAIRIVNEDVYTGDNTGRAKFIHSNSGDFPDRKLYPGQTVELFLQNGRAWLDRNTPWRPTHDVVFNISTTGSDASDGLATGSGAMATGQYCVDVIAEELINTVPVNVKCKGAPGTYAWDVLLKPYVGTWFYQGPGQPVFEGDCSDPTSVTLVGGSDHTAIFLSSAMISPWTIQCMTIAPTFSDKHGIFLDWKTNLDVASLNFNGGADAFFVRLDSNLEILGVTAGSNLPTVINVAGTMDKFWQAQSNSNILIQGAGITINMVGTPHFNTAFVIIDQPSTIDTHAVTFTGSATGYKFSSDGGNFAKVDPSTFPGSMAGLYTRRIPNPVSTYYVCPSGSNSLNGGQAIGTPWQTVSYGYGWLQANVDTLGQSIIFVPCNSTYTENVGLNGPLFGGGNFSIQGSSSASVIWNNSSGSSFSFNNGAQVSLSGVKCTEAAGHCIVAEGPGTIVGYSGMDFGTSAGDHILADNYATVNINGSYTISGNFASHWSATNGATIRNQAVTTITFSNSPVASTAFAFTNVLSMMGLSGITFGTGANTVTGTRYSSNALSVIGTGGGGANYLPGNSAGTTSAGGIYQ